MKWSWKLGRLAGIDVYVHATFVMLLAWIAMAHWVEGQTLAAVVAGVGLIVVLFACVVAHEFGHALTARRYGIGTRDITLLPIGGLARLERMPTDPGQELRVALAGPAVNLVIAGLLFVWLWVTGGWQPLGEISVARGAFLEQVMAANLILMAFNLLPAFPMDGGRVLRALLATRKSYVRATEQAASVGQGLALVMGFIGLLSNPVLLFIAFFVWIGAAQEATAVQTKSALAGATVKHAMLTRFQTLTPADTIADAIDLLLTGSQQDFPVLQRGEVVGMLTRQDLIAALPQRGRDAAVGPVMRDCPTAEQGEMLEAALARLHERACKTLAVTEHGSLVGLLTLDNIGEFMMVQAAERA